MTLNTIDQISLISNLRVIMDQVFLKQYFLKWFIDSKSYPKQNKLYRFPQRCHVLWIQDFLRLGHCFYLNVLLNFIVLIGIYYDF